MPPSIAFATRGSLQGLRLQLALLDREFDDLDYDTLRAFDSDNISTTPSMSEEGITCAQVQESWSRECWIVTEAGQLKQDSRTDDGSTKALEDELTCTICLDQVNRGNLFGACHVCIKFYFTFMFSSNDYTISVIMYIDNNLILQFHAGCIDPWLQQQGTYPVCKFKMGSRWQENRESE
ncbi:hypothetical protein F3Y22_tig00110419pilonHSYRG00161 [Hibiscus syriacus]|uniref:RING-type E3 ubiquitin transferase n=1 Tax=Hibiscus syriacus TaxID=106335 RepID=A0A6A3AM18_HIBSY|nr:hypothetical protein F3Y22_tig00110419pilonHSYRG00161 [Hibiscus syriacus]